MDKGDHADIAYNLNPIGIGVASVVSALRQAAPQDSSLLRKRKPSVDVGLPHNLKADNHGDPHPGPVLTRACSILRIRVRVRVTGPVLPRACSILGLLVEYMVRVQVRARVRFRARFRVRVRVCITVRVRIRFRLVWCLEYL